VSVETAGWCEAEPAPLVIRRKFADRYNTANRDKS
jgi:hypothetical protein